MADTKPSAMTEDTTPDPTDVVWVQTADGLTDKRIPLSSFGTQAELDAEAALARNADNLTSGTVADARIASTIARDSEVTAAVAAEATLARNADNLTSGTVADARIASTIARDSEVTAAADAKVSDTAYDEATWNGVTTVAPSKNAVRDQFEALRVFENGVGTTIDAGTPGFLSVDIANVVPTKAVTLASHPTITGARFATIVALPACTYANGASGVGATLTGDAVGALSLAPETPAGTLVAGDRILVKNQASAFQNGVYDVTVLGDGATAFVLTRAAEMDVAADYVDGVTVMVSDGEINKGAVYHCAGTITIGTTSIVWICSGTPNAAAWEQVGGQSRDRRRYANDFDNFDTAITTNAAGIPGTTAQVFLTGTAAQVTQQHSAGTEPTACGVAALETGTQATGSVAVTLSRHFPTISVATYARFSARFRTPTVTTSGVEDFDCWLGFFSFIIGTDPVNCIALKAPAAGGNYLAVTRSAGTPTETDTGIAQATSYRSVMIVVDPIAAAVRFYTNVSGVGMSLVATNTTNIPNAALAPGAYIDKKTGTTMRDLRVDQMTADIPDIRTNMAMT